MLSLGSRFSTDPVSSFPCVKCEVIEIDSKTQVNDAFRTLIQNNLLSAPVYDQEAKQYLGFFEVQDAIGFATNMTTLFNGESTDQTTHQVGAMLKAQENKRGTAPWVPVSPDTSMSEVINLLSRVRRVPVIDSASNKVIKVISQSLVSNQVSEALRSMEGDIPKRFLQTPREFGIAMREVLTVPEDTTARDAFNMLIDNNVSAVGVLDEEGGLLTCITAKDIRLLPLVDAPGEESVEQLLSLQAVDFVSKARLVAEKRGKARPAVSVVNLDTPVHQMIAKLAKTNMHRLFLVDKEHKPCGVFSVSDVVNLLVE